MSENVEKLRQSEGLIDELSGMIPVFLESYETLHGDTAINGMPRRVQLSSLILRLLFQNPELTMRIATVFFSDMNVRKFFSIDENADVVSGGMVFAGDCCVMDSSGSGGTQQPISIISNIFLAAVDLCVLEKGAFDETTIAANLHKTVLDFKAFMQGKKVEEVHLIGFSGFATEGDTRIGFGTLNAFALNDFQSTYFFGKANGIGFVIKEIFNRQKLFSGSPDQMQQFIESNRLCIDAEFFNNMNLLIKNVRLALVLALSTEENAFPSFIEGDYLITSTGNLNSFIQHGVMINRKTTSLRLDQKSVNQLSIKYLTIVDANLGSIEVAIKRLLSAVCSRDNDDDALIDAVMCWENIIGSESEVTFRTCASIARVLADNKEARSEIYKKLKEIYKARSALVHGNSKYKTDPGKTRQAIFYAIGLLNAVLEDKELLRMDGVNRSEHIMLSRS